MRSRSLSLFVPLGLLACGGNWEAGAGTVANPNEAPPAELTPAPMGLHAVGNRIQDADGNVVTLRGANRSGSEYQCSKDGGAFFDGATDSESLREMLKWKLNAVRVPLNETCWLGINGVSPLIGGDPYKGAIKDYVTLLQAHGLVPILDLHWAAPGGIKPAGLWPMPNTDHTLEFWYDVASTFADNDGVIFEPYNEPYPDRNQDTDAAWDCWQNGCDALQWNQTEPYAAVGMQAIVDEIRRANAPQLVLLGGVQYSNSLSQWLAHQPTDPLANLGAAWHVYNFNGCNNSGCYNGAPASVAAEVPIVATEIGQADCKGDTFLNPLMQWMDGQGISYLAWSWNTGSVCTPRMGGSEGAPWALITSYSDAEPASSYAQTFRDHLAAVVP